MFRKLWNAARGTRRARDNGRTSRRPGLETLEDRCVPASVWTGSVSELWNNPANWNTGFVPANGGNVEFGPTFGGANGNSIDNIPGLSLATMAVDSLYTSTITLDTSLTVTTQISQSNGTIATEDASEVLTNGGTFNWYGGTLSGAGTLLNAGSVYPKYPYYRIAANFNVDGGQNLGINVLNDGNVNWGDSANIYMFGGAVITNNPTGIISITTPGSIIDSYLQGSYFINHYGAYGGQINVATSGAVNIDIGISLNDNVNYGTISVTSGSLVFADGSGLQFINGGYVNDDSYVEFDIEYNQVANADWSGFATRTGTSANNISEVFAEGATIDAGLLYCGNGYGADTVTVDSDLMIGAGGTVEVDDYSPTLTYATLNVTGDIEDSGTVEMYTDGTTQGSVVVNTGTLFINTQGNPNALLHGIGYLEENTCVVNAAVSNAGVVTAYNLTVNGSFTQTEGTTNLGALYVTAGVGGTGLFSEIAGVVNFGTGGQGGTLTATGECIIGYNFDVLTGGGVITTGLVIDNGTINYASANMSFSIVGNYEQYGTLNTQVSGGSGDVMFVTGNATVIGVVNVIVDSPVTSGSTFGVIQTQGTISDIGSVQVVNLPSGLTFGWTLLNNFPNEQPGFPPIPISNGLWVAFA